MTSQPLTPRSETIYTLAFNDTTHQWHYDRHNEPADFGWVLISEPCPEYQLRLFTYFMDFSPKRKKVSAREMMEEWSRFKQWLHWFEACGINCQQHKLPDYDLLEDVFSQIMEKSQPIQN